MTKHLPVIGITMGDPSGIGPEIIIKALADRRLYKLCIPVVLGDPDTLAFYMEKQKDAPVIVKTKHQNVCAVMMILPC